MWHVCSATFVRASLWAANSSLSGLIDSTFAHEVRVHDYRVVVFDFVKDQSRGFCQVRQNRFLPVAQTPVKLGVFLLKSCENF